MSDADVLTANSRAVGALRQLAVGKSLDDATLELLRDYGDGDPEAGPRLQRDVIDSWAEDGEVVGGWKIAWTSRAARDRGGVGYRPFGYILKSRIFDSGDTLPININPNPSLESEICVVLGKPLAGPDVTVEQAIDAVSFVAPSFEIGAKRMPAGLSLATRIGNAMNNWGLVLGEKREPTFDIAGLAVTMRRDGEVVATGSSDPETLDSPYLSLTRVCKVLHQVGRGLEPGHVLITGAILPGLPVAAGSTYDADFGELGVVKIGFSEPTSD